MCPHGLPENLLTITQQYSNAQFGEFDKDVSTQTERLHVTIQRPSEPNRNTSDFAW